MDVSRPARMGGADFPKLRFMPTNTLDERGTQLQVLGAAPDFDLPAATVPGHESGRAALSDYAGRWLIVLFYPRDFSLVCPTEVSAFSARLEEFQRRNCEVVGISVDPVDVHQQWIDLPPSEGGLGGLRFPLASDEDGAVARAYGVYHEVRGVALRGLFIVDPRGVLQYQVVHNQMVGRHTDEVLRVLDALQSEGLCAESWKSSEATIDPTNVLGPGRVVSHYRIQDRIGHGTFAVVFRAWDMQLDRPVALKILKSSPESSLDSVLAEARAAAALSHPHACTVYAVENVDGVPFIAMEYLSGHPLSKLLSDGPLDVSRVRRLARHIGSALVSAHGQGLVHGDLKPANVVVSPEDYAKVLDFGLAYFQRRRIVSSLPMHADPEATQFISDAKQGIVGTPAYMAPEQGRGEPSSFASDVFAFGCVLFEMLSGSRAVPGNDFVETLARLDRFQVPAAAKEFPAPFAEIVSATLEPRPESRASMSDLMPLLV